MINHRNVGPLREIVDWAPHFTVFGHGAAILACGHEKIAKRGTRSKRTRCYGCESGKPAVHPHNCIGKWPDRHLDWCVLCQSASKASRDAFRWCTECGEVPTPVDQIACAKCRDAVSR